MAVLVGAVSAAYVMVAPEAGAASSVGGTIVRSEVLDRAQFWVDRAVVYSQNRTYDDPGGKNYRTDCSGYVAMAWHMTTTGTWLDGGLNTSGFASYSGKTVISRSSLKPGDALLRSGHIELFAKWKDPGNHSLGAYVYSLNGPTDRDWAKGPTRNSHGQIGFDTDAEMQTYTAIRYNKIVDDPVVVTPIDGQLYREPNGTIALIVGGAPAKFTSMAELTQTGYGSATWTSVPAGWFDALPETPRDGTLLRSAVDGEITLVVGGAGYALSYDEWQALGRPVARNTPLSYIESLSTVPLTGTLLRDVATGAIWLVAGGAGYHLSPEHYTELGSPTFTNVPVGFIDTLAATPADGTYLRNVANGAIWLTVGGAKYWVTPDEFDQLGGPTFTNAPVDWISSFGSIPADGHYLRRITDGTIYVMTGGAKRALSYDEWIALGKPASTNVPVGFLDIIPDA